MGAGVIPEAVGTAADVTGAEVWPGSPVTGAWTGDTGWDRVARLGLDRGFAIGLMGCMIKQNSINEMCTVHVNKTGYRYAKYDICICFNYNKETVRPIE